MFLLKLKLSGISIYMSSDFSDQSQWLHVILTEWKWKITDDFFYPSHRNLSTIEPFQHPTCRILTWPPVEWWLTRHKKTVSQQYRDSSLQLLRHDTDTEKPQTYKRLHFDFPTSTHTTSGFSIMTFFIDLLRSKNQAAISERFGINKAGSGIILHLQIGSLKSNIY